MLRLILGRAKSGKTSLVMGEIRDLVRAGSGAVLLVPEQYSHEAETELLRVCGDSLSLYAEVLSFTRLCARVEEELGKPAGTLLDQGGRLACMSLALQSLGPRLTAFGAAARKPELQSAMLEAVGEFKSARITPEALRNCAAKTGGALADKLSDFSLISEAYDAIVAQGRLDPSDRLDFLSASIGRSELIQRRFYLDGFTDFTAQELKVIESLLCAETEVTVCLTCLGLTGNEEIAQCDRR